MFYHGRSQVLVSGEEIGEWGGVVQHFNSVETFGVAPLAMPTVCMSWRVMLVIQ